MYKLVCNEFGFDCDFVIKNNNKEVIADNFCNHLLNHHDHYLPTKEAFEFIDNRDVNASKNYDAIKSDKWFQGRKNFP